MAKAPTNTGSRFPAIAMEPPKLTAAEWNGTMLLGLVFIVMALLQLISFNGFKDALTGIGLSGPSAWGAVLILIELWAAAAFFKLKLSLAFRMASSFFALVVSGFWFYESVRMVSVGPATLTNNGFFGRFLTQAPGWWTVVEATIVLVWTLWAVSLTNVDSGR